MYSAVVTMAWIQHAFGGAPQWLLSILLVLGAIVAAGIVSLLPALLKHTLGINEVVVGILLNNIMLCLSDYMIRYTAIAELNKSVAMSIQIVPTFSRMSLLVASVVIMVAYTLIMRNTVPGYRLRMVGSNPTFSKSNGLHVIRIVLIVSFIGGAFSGLAAAGETMGIYHRHALGLRRWHGLFRHDGGADRQGEPAGHGARLAASGRAAKRLGQPDRLDQRAGGDRECHQGLRDALCHGEPAAILPRREKGGGEMSLTYILSLALRLCTPVLLISIGGMFVLKANIFNLALEALP